MSTLSHASNVEKPSIGSIIKNGAIAGGIGAVVNAVLFFLGTGHGLVFRDDSYADRSAHYSCRRDHGYTDRRNRRYNRLHCAYTLLKQRQADLTFLILASLVLVGMAITPLQLPGADVLTIVLLQVMHVVIGVALMYFLPKSV